MKTKKYHIYISAAERSEIIQSLVDFRNKLISQGRYTDAVDDVLCKITAAKRKKIKIVSEHGMT